MLEPFDQTRDPVGAIPLDGGLAVMNDGGGFQVVAPTLTDEIATDGGELPGEMTIGALTDEAPSAFVTRSLTVIDPADEYVREGWDAVESSYCPSPSRSHA